MKIKTIKPQLVVGEGFYMCHNMVLSLIKKTILALHGEEVRKGFNFESNLHYLVHYLVFICSSRLRCPCQTL